jgi:DNA-binding transcriptional MocR family regulator
MTAFDIATRAREAGINLEPFHLSTPPDKDETGLLLGFGVIAAEEIDPAIRFLAAILN